MMPKTERMLTLVEMMEEKDRLIFNLLHRRANTPAWSNARAAIDSSLAEAVEQQTRLYKLAALLNGI